MASYPQFLSELYIRSFSSHQQIHPCSFELFEKIFRRHYKAICYEKLILICVESVVMFCDKLTDEQAEVCQFARNGHNILITGQAGTGKSTVVNAIRNECKQRGLQVDLICSSGIACQVYERGAASTVHSYYGLGAADMTSQQLVLRSLSDSRVKNRLGDVDVIIWDEASMSSARMLEIANALHHTMSEEENLFPFAGTQVIIVGEFLQLRPVPSPLDSAEFMFTSKVFEHAIPHRFQLTKLLRQSESTAYFLNALSDVRLGICSAETAAFIKSLSRSLDQQLSEITTHIFFKKNAVLLFNRSRLDDLSGEVVRFDAMYEGNSEKISWPGERTLHLKAECKVMLIWNNSDELKNGSIGTFKKVVDDKLLVDFEKVGTVAVDRVTWVRRNRRGEKIGGVTQYPLILAYAITCHKSQGLELPAVVLHSSKEFVPGLVYVAMSRVRSQDTLQVTGFNSNHLLPADTEVIDRCKRDIGQCNHSLHCCRKRPTTGESFFEVHDRFESENSDNDAEDFYQFPVDVSNGIVQSYFELEGTNTNISVAELFEQIESRESELSSPPSEGFDIIALLNELKVKPSCTSFRASVNEALEALMTPRYSENLKAFVNIVWFHSFLALEKHIVENSDDLDVKVTRGDFTTATAKLHALFTSPDFSQYVKCLFNITTFTAAQRSVAVEIGTAVFLKFLQYLLDISSKERQQEVVSFDVEQMPDAGKAKVRHVGAWAIRKTLEKSRRYVRANIYTENTETMKSVRRHHIICELIEESLVGSLAVLEKESQHKETLQVTEARQYRERSLVHIEDTVYSFFMALESQRVQLLNDQEMRRQGSQGMVDVAYHKLISNQQLELKWEECFTAETISKQKVRKKNNR